MTDERLALKAFAGLGVALQAEDFSLSFQPVTERIARLASPLHMNLISHTFAMRA